MIWSVIDSTSVKLNFHNFCKLFIRRSLEEIASKFESNVESI